MVEKKKGGGNAGEKSGVRQGEVGMERDSTWVNSEFQRKGGI